MPEPGHGATLTHLNRNLKLILAAIEAQPSRVYAVGKTGNPSGKSESLLQEIESAVDGLEALIAATNTKLDDVIVQTEEASDGKSIADKLFDIQTNVDGLEVRLDDIIVQTEEAPSGKSIADLLVDIQTNVDGLEVRLDQNNTDNAAILALLATIDSDTNEIGNNTDNLETLLATNGGETVTNKLEQIVQSTESTDQNWNILSVNQLNLAAILAAVLNNATSGKQDSANTLLTTIKDNVVDIDNNTDRLEAILDLQSNAHWWAMLDITVNSIAGGTQVDFTWTPPAGDLIRHLKIEYLGITGNNTIEILLEDAGATATSETVHTSTAETAGTPLSIPENSSVKTQRELEVSAVTEDMQVRVKITGVAASDQFEISFNGRMRKLVAPTFDSTNSTATITTTTVLNQVR